MKTDERVSVVKQRRVSSVVTTLCVIALCLAALVSPGVSTTEVEMNDGGVWVTNSKLRLVAHLNYPSRSLDSGLRADSDIFDIAQNGEEVFVNDIAAASLSQVDVAHSVLRTPTDFSAYSTTIDGGTLAVTDAIAGKVWVLPSESYADFNPEDVEPDVADVPGAVVAIGQDGSVHIASATTATVTSIPPGGQANDVRTRHLKDVTEESVLQVAAVGSQAVVFDKTASTLYIGEDQALHLDEEMELQESGPESGEVLLASPQKLLAVPLKGGYTRVTENGKKSGEPSRPVMHRGCAYGAWAGTGAFVRDCDGEDDDVVMSVDTLQDAEQAVFRVNRDVIVLNDITSGGLWLPDEQMFMVDNWDQVNSEVESQEETVKKVEQTILPERGEKNTAPVAVDDEFGVRAGRRTILPVLLNDSDADGDFITATPVSQPRIGTVSVARDGAALDITVKEGQTGSSTFEYEVSDGRGGKKRAKVKVSVHGDEVNSPPVQLTERTVSLGTGKKASTNALTSWYDPDGDPFYLEHVVAPKGISVRSHENGALELLEAGHGPGHDEMTLVVSDGRDLGEGAMSLAIKEGGNEPPIANTDFVTVKVGSTATLSPLDNDSDPDGDTLRLLHIDGSSEGVTASMDEATGTVTVKGRAVGTSYLGYRIVDGPNTADGVIRVDVLDTTDFYPPSAESDLGVLPNGGEIVVDLLANDTDPMGGVLSVQNLNVSMDSNLVVALTDHQMVRISAPEGLVDPETFSYVVSNGFESTTATVTVFPAEVGKENLPPELTDDTLVVRTGDVGTVAVLANDRHPSGLKMTVSDELEHEISADVAGVFISNNVIRVRGGSRGGSGRVVYTVRDSMGNTSSAVLHLTVMAADPERNTAPRPQEINARTTAGKPVDIQIPLDGIDPEGDSVYLVSPGSMPRLGDVELEGTVVTYTPSSSARGTDTFSYIVEDRLGKQAMGYVRVGIAPPSGVNQNPVAMPDVVHMRPGATMSVAVLANDTDPDGDEIQLDSERITPQSEGIEAAANSNRIVLRAPEKEGTYPISYGIEDGQGGSADGILTVSVSAGAQLVAPIVRDDDVPVADVRAATGDTVNVPVLRNDEDLDGDIRDVTITSPDIEVSPAPDGTVDVKLAPENQVLVYTVTDADGLKASAVIRVPGTEAQRPVVNQTALPIKVKAGEPTDIAVNDYVATGEGQPVRITSEAKVSTGVGHAGGQLVKDASTLTYTAAKDFAGFTSVSFEVAGASDLNGPGERAAMVTLPILVEAVGNHPPEFNSTTIQAVVGESTSVDLRPMVSDPDEGDAKNAVFFIKGSPPEGLDVSLRGSILEISAVTDASRGNIGSIKVTVDDGKGGVVDAGIPVAVVSSSRPLIQTSEAKVTLEAGKVTSVDVAQYATNPFDEKDDVSIVGPPTVSAGGSATARGTVIDVQANAGFSGTFTVTYRLADATGDATREVEGKIVATVRGKPSPPNNVSAISQEPGTALISWISGPANGASITNFTVTDHTQGDSKECGKVSSCLLEDRTIGVEHTFSVTATNEVGESERSKTTTARVDAVPETPKAPVLTPGDGELTVSWSPPSNAGSEVLEYIVTLSPGGQYVFEASGARDTGTQTEKISGLTNGTEYTASVVARNAKDSSPASPTSAPAVPYGAPGKVGAVKVEYAPGSGTGKTATIDVSWEAPTRTNGRPIEYYTVRAGSATKKVPASSRTSTKLDGVGFSEEPVKVSVTATNDESRPDKNTSPPVTTSVRVVGQPPAPSLTAVNATGEDNAAMILWSGSPNGRGWNPDDLTYEWSVGKGWHPLSGNIISGRGLSNGITSTVQIRAVGTTSGSTVYSSPSRGVRVVPFGPPTAPSMDCVGAENAVKCTWRGGSGNGRDVTYMLSGAASGRVGASGSKTLNVSGGSSASLCVTVTQKETGRIGKRCSSATAPKSP